MLKKEYEMMDEFVKVVLDEECQWAPEHVQGQPKGC